MTFPRKNIASKAKKLLLVRLKRVNDSLWRRLKRLSQAGYQVIEGDLADVERPPDAAGVQEGAGNLRLSSASSLRVVDELERVVRLIRTSMTFKRNGRA